MVGYGFQMKQFPDLVGACAAAGEKAKEREKMNRE